MKIKLAILAAMVAALIAAAFWFRGVIAERDKLRAQKQLAEATTKMYADAWNRNADLQEAVTNAVSKIRVESNTYIDRMEAAQSPVIPAGGSIVFISPGVSKPLSGLPGFGNYTANRTTANNATSGLVATGDGNRGLLPD